MNSRFHSPAGLALALCLFATLPARAADEAQFLRLSTRARAQTAKGSDEWRIVERTAAIEPARTAIVICDMWDTHTCSNSARRVAEMAPRMNEVVKKARGQGAFIIHCPSDTMKFYEGTPGRKLAQAAPKVEPKVPLQRWCYLDKTKEAALPIDDSDGGCDADTQWPKGKPYPWTRQIATIEIKDGDAITESAEAYYLMRERGITNVIVMGVHLNMCVLGRPFSVRQMVAQGQNVFLVRDMTDTMYNPRRAPYVPHCVGNDLMVEHVEKYWCPTIASTAFVGGEEFRFKEDVRPHVVFLIGEDEYKTWETLPPFVTNELAWRGMRVSIIQQSADDKHRFPGFTEAMRDASLLFVSTRRRALPKEQLDLVRAHLAAGKPLIGIRTANHAFDPRGKDAERGDAWPTFGSDVIACTYNSHWGAGPKTTIEVAKDAAAHELLTGIDPARLTGNGSLYRVSPLKPAAKPLLIGSIPDKRAEPVAWTYTYGPNNARIFYTSLGHAEDFAQPAFRRLLLNAVLWSVRERIPPQTATPPSRAAGPARNSVAFGFSRNPN